RIVLTGSFTAFSVQTYLAQQRYPGIGSVRFLANALRTQSHGVDLRAGYDLALAGLALRLGGTLAHQTMRVTLTDSATGVLTPFTTVFFGPAERTRWERGQPRDNLLLGAAARKSRWSLGLRSQRFGSVTGPGTNGTPEQRYGAKWITDASL